LNGRQAATTAAGKLGILKPEHRATVPHAATEWELLGLIRKGWGAQNERVSIMMRKIAIGLVAAAIATAGSTLSASAIPSGGRGESAIPGGGGAYVDVVRFGGGGFGRGGFGRGGFSRGFGHGRFGFGREFGHRGFGFGRGFGHRGFGFRGRRF
jgi:hypothetical protein